MEKLWCWKCKTHKETSAFYKNRASSTGFEQLCKVCKSEHSKKRRARRKLEGLCPCGRKPNGGFETCEKCRQRRNDWGNANTDYMAQQRTIKYATVRQKVFDHYGWACVCCGESNHGFLTMDHVEGGGNKHRKELGLAGNAFYAWLVREGYPEGFQTQCYNCNCGRAHNGGICPHKRAKLTLVAPHTDASTDHLPSAPVTPITASGHESPGPALN